MLLAPPSMGTFAVARALYLAPVGGLWVAAPSVLAGLPMLWCALGFACVVVELALPKPTHGYFPWPPEHGLDRRCHGYVEHKLPTGSKVWCMGGMSMLGNSSVLPVQVAELALPNPTNGRACGILSMCTIAP